MASRSTIPPFAVPERAIARRAPAAAPPDDVPCIVLATGASGGHVTPALAVAEAFREAVPAARVHFVGPSTGSAIDLVARSGHPLEPFDVRPLRGAGPTRWLRGAASLPGAGLTARRILGRLHPDVVVGTGGATSGPLVAVAAAMGIRTVALEANVEPGLANLWLRPFVDAFATAWPEAAHALGRSAETVGYPVRRGILDVGDGAPPETGRTHHVLVLGGSAGAAEIDRAMASAATVLGDVPGIAVTHQSSGGAIDDLRRAYAGARIPADVSSFIADIDREYARSHLVVARAGGVTMAELAAAGRPSIVVPLPAAGDHQRANAVVWSALGAGVHIPPERLDGVALGRTIVELLGDSTRREAMRGAALSLRRPRAGQHVVALCLAGIRR